MIGAVLFDFDGTLVDTAPGLAQALNLLRERRGLPALPFEVVRPGASHGAPGLLGIGFGINANDPSYAGLRLEFLDLYEANLLHEAALFPGIGLLLAELEQREIPWGIVTNKLERYTHPLLEHLGLEASDGCVVCGDSCSTTKPDPEPMFCASRAIKRPPEACLYVGDAERDMVAARAAGMKGVVAAYGYLGEHDRPEDWSPWRVDTPPAILDFLG